MNTSSNIPGTRMQILFFTLFFPIVKLFQNACRKRMFRKRMCVHGVWYLGTSSPLFTRCLVLTFSAKIEHIEHLACDLCATTIKLLLKMEFEKIVLYWFLDSIEWPIPQ